MELAIEHAKKAGEKLQAEIGSGKTAKRRISAAR
jgi:hypothetical protein